MINAGFVEVISIFMYLPNVSFLQELFCFVKEAFNVI